MAISKALARPLREHLDDAVAATVVVAQPLADEVCVRGDLVAVPGQQPGEWHGGRFAAGSARYSTRARGRVPSGSKAG